MSNLSTSYSTVEEVALQFKNSLESTDHILVFAHNGTGKTRLSMAFKDAHKKTKGKKKAETEAYTKNTLYFNAFTEDLFSWDNDLENDSERVLLRLNKHSQFFKGLEELEMDSRIRKFLERYADFDFKIDYEKWEVIFSRQVPAQEFRAGDPVGKTHDEVTHIKISRGEENLFIWCFFLAVVELAMDDSIEAYSWVQYIYIDDPISSLDENNIIAVACDLMALFKENKGQKKVIISTHHCLFYNILAHEFRWTRDPKLKHLSFYYQKSKEGNNYELTKTQDTHFFHHIALLNEIQQTIKQGTLYTYHFNILRTILEKTSSFFGYNQLSDCMNDCINWKDNETLYDRALNLLSHGKHQLFEPRIMTKDNKELFIKIFNSFIEHYNFNLSEQSSMESDTL